MPSSKKRNAPSGSQMDSKGENGWGKKGSKGSKLAITSYEDVADKEDAFHLQRDRVMLDGEGPDTKRRRREGDEGNQHCAWSIRLCCELMGW
jgi:hypothetical protein